jgi:L-cysteate sulfo-lyase
MPIDSPAATQFAGALADIPRVALAQLPTPVMRAVRLGTAIGLDDLWVKRDDNTGLCLGGNKVRKLEYLMGDALQRGADVIITTGAPQSNHCRLTAAAAAACGVEAHLVFAGPPVDVVQGNLLLDRLLGATWSFTADGQTADDCMAQRAAELTAEGRTPYVIPLGGSNGLGALGYVAAAFEMLQQMRADDVEPSAIVCAASSCGTLAGLALGAQLAQSDARIVGISVSRSAQDRSETTWRLMMQAAGILGVRCSKMLPAIVDDYVGEGYGIPSVLSAEALDLAARTTGLILDPVYTAKAFGGLIGEVRRGAIRRDERVVFVHTGGTPALFADTHLYWRRDPK